MQQIFHNTRLVWTFDMLFKIKLLIKNTPLNLQQMILGQWVIVQGQQGDYKNNHQDQ